jgi:meso-butanediol dehydrogenase/(S,S)-butanediol dehydrogenase/diacetyl reductase
VKGAPVALVTGAARGLGLAMVERLLNEGYRVMATDLAASGEHWNYALGDIGNLAARLADYGENQLKTCALDVTSAASCQAAVATTIDHFGQLNLLVNNAGVVDSGPIETFSEADWDRIFAVNTKGIFLMTQAAVEALARAENASIVNTASIAGKKGVRHMAAYCGSKFAAIGVTQSLAQELAPKGIRVNAICPGIVGTAMWLEHLMPKAQSASNEVPEFSNYVSQLIPMGEPQTAEDMANAVVYLAQASNVTGIALTVAGGMEMN